MFITKKHISRRTLLKGAGVALGLPLLDSMFPAATALAQAAAAPPRRFFAGFVPHGAAPGYWVPEKEGALPAELPFIWKPLEPYPPEPHDPDRPALDFVRAAARRDGRRPLGRRGVPLRRQAEENGRRRRARRPNDRPDHRGEDRRARRCCLPWRCRSKIPGSGSSNCGEGYSCVYTNTIAWASPTTPLPMELNPQVVFERMFGSGSTPEQRVARRERNQSILDSINGKIVEPARARSAFRTVRVSTASRRTSGRSSVDCRSPPKPRRRRPRISPFLPAFRSRSTSTSS